MEEVPRLSRAQFLPADEIALKVIWIDEHGSSQRQHMHEFSELVVITAGCGIHWVENQKYQLTTGDIFVIQENTRHAYQKTQKLGLINLLFDNQELRLPSADLEMLSGYQALFQIEPRVRRRRFFSHRLKLNLKSLEELLIIVSDLGQELRHKAPGYQFAAIANWMRIITYLSRAYDEKSGNKIENVHGLSRVLRHMETHLTEPLSVEQLASVAGMSQPSLFRVFQASVGCAPIEHLMQLRMERAKRLLQNSQLRVGEISEMVGFEDSNYFARQFRRHAGMSAREWRNMLSAPGKSGQVKHLG